MNKDSIPKWLILILAVVFILRIPSFLEPYSYGDEMIYLTLGNAVRRGLTLYRDIHDNKPPLLYLMAAIAGNLFWFKTILTFWQIATIYVFWRFTRMLFFKKETLIRVSVLIFALLNTLPLLEGNIANAELFMIGPTILAFYLLFLQPHSDKRTFLAGMLFAIAALFKIPAIFDIPAVFIFWLVEEKLSVKRVKTILTSTCWLAAGFSLPIALTFVWYWTNGAFKEYLIAAFLQNFGYLSSWRPDDIQKPFLVKNGPLLVRAGIVFAGNVMLIIYKKRVNNKFLFFISWLLFSLFAVTLSERPYPHYLIQITPPLAVLLATLFVENSIEQAIAVLPLALAFFVPFYYKFWYYQTSSYYLRFYNLLTGKVSQGQYLKSFGGHIEIYYRVADYLKKSSHPDDTVFVWGDSGLIYALSNRLPPTKYIADYHVKDFVGDDPDFSVVWKQLPDFVVVTHEAEKLPQLDKILQENYGLIQEIQSVKIWKLLNRNIRQLIAP